MRKLLLLFLFININITAYNQIIKGTVSDKETRIPIDFASLYFSGTFVGTHTDKNGNFELDVSKNASKPLTISAIGYYSETLTDFSTRKPLLIYMIPKVYELREVTINAKSLARERKANLVLFKKEFLGTTENAMKCEITNENDITFNYGSDKDTLKAFASKPIIIYNRGLGYKITYYLDKFEYDKRSKSFFFKGNIIFNEDMSTVEEQNQYFERRRKYAYLGSRMHFFRTLWLDDLRSTGFRVRNSIDQNLNYKDIVIQEDDQRKYLKNTGNLRICYFTNMPLSTIEFLKDKVYFDETGYFDPSGIGWDGEMAQLRIADWLPYEYTVK